MKKEEKSYLVYIVIALLLGLGLGYFYAWLMTSPETYTIIEENPNTFFVNNEDPSIGSKDAKVVIVEFTDYQCPYCKDYYHEAFHGIIEKYANEGKILYVFRDFPLEVYPQSLQAANAANCAGEQNKYWEMHNILLEKQQEWSYKDNYEEVFYNLALEIEIDAEKHKNCVKSEKYNFEISEDAKDGVKQDVKFAPTFFINGQKVVGFQRIQTFETIIEQELAKVAPPEPEEPEKTEEDTENIEAAEAVPNQ